jgi:hypothetical protein
MVAGSGVMKQLVCGKGIRIGIELSWEREFSIG